MFLVGADELSRRWLARHRERLAELKAVGLLVQAADDAKVQAVWAAAPELTIMPVSADELARRLQLTRYPVLIHREGIEQ